MTSDFGAMLTRLLAQRGLEAGTLARAIGAPETELVAVLDGAEPPAPLLRRLAPALGLHVSDLFLIAGLRLPEDLAPAGRHSVGTLEHLVWSMARIPGVGPEVGRRVNDLLRSMPGQASTEPVRPLQYDKWFLPGVGAMLLRLFANRNLTYFDAVKVLYLLTGFGPWSPVTLTMVGSGRKEVPGDLVAACAVVLDIPAGDLAALAGMDPPERVRWTDPATSEAVELIWAARGIPGEQMAQVTKRAHAIRHEYDDVLPPNLVCHCPLFRGPKAVTQP